MFLIRKSWTLRSILRKNLRIAVLGLAMISSTTAIAQTTRNPTPTNVFNNGGTNASGNVASNAEVPSRTYFNRRSMVLPVRVDERMRGQIQEVLLYCKDAPQNPWVLRDRLTQGQASGFRFTAPRDGEFWFSMVTVDRQGRAFPPSPDHEPPGLVVVIDTTPPAVSVQAVGETDEGALFEVAVQDENIDPTKTRFQFQSGDRMFRPVEPVAGRQNVFCVPKQAVWTGLARVSAGDQAGNSAQREINLNGNPLNQAQAGVPTNPAPVINPQGEVIVAVDPPPTQFPTTVTAQRPVSRVAPQETPVFEFSNQQPLSAPNPVVEKPRTQPRNLPDLNRGTEAIHPTEPSPSLLRPKNGATTTTRRDGLTVRKIVSNPRLALNYQIDQVGASGVGKIEVWTTRDMGQSWQKIAEDRDRKSPLEVTLPGEGIFGLSVVVTNGRGFGGTPPNPGDTPEMWVEVDTTRPSAEIVDIRNADDEPSTVQVIWKTTDKNLSGEPVDLFYSKDRQGPWQVLAKGLRNTGQYRWTPNAEVGPQAYVKLVVKDLAGNQSTSETLQPVLLDDLSRPRARILGIATTASGTVTPTSGTQPLPVTVPLPPIVDERNDR